MGNKISSALTLSFLLIAAFCLEAFIIQRTFYCPAVKMNWKEARLYCQKNYIDLVTEEFVDRSQLAEFLMEIEVKEVWVGLLKYPEKDSLWKWVNLDGEEGISEDDLSQSTHGTNGQQSSQCAVVAGYDLKWHSVKCSSRFKFYCSQNNNIQYQNITHNWYEASQYCHDNNMGDLATITRTDELQEPGWIGLYLEDDVTWKWIGDQPNEYTNWAEGEPTNAECGFFNTTTEKWHSKVCSERLRFVCYDDNLVVVNENKTWEEALSHCRSMQAPCWDSSNPCKYRHDLLSPEYSSQYNYIRKRIHGATTDEVWTSLRFLGTEWWWMNGRKPQDQGMLPDCPSQWKHCGTLSKYDTNNWIIRDCSERRNFICSRKKLVFSLKKKKIKVRLTNTGEI